MKNLFFLKILFSLIVLSLLVYFIDFTSLVSIMRNVKPFYLVLSLFLLIPNIFIQWYRWNALVRIRYKHAGFRSTFPSLLIGLSFGLLTPGRMGEIGRAWFTEYEDKPVLAGYTLLEKFYGQAALLIMGIPALFYFFHEILIHNSAMYISLVIIYLLLTVFVLFSVLYPHKIVGSVKNISFIQRSKLLKNISLGFEQFNRFESIRLFILSCAFPVVYIFQFYVIMSSFGDFPFFSGMITLTAVMLMNILAPFFFGNLGIRELSAIYFLGNTGLPAEAAFDGSLILFLINLIIPALAGYVLFVTKFKKTDNGIKITEQA